MSLTLGGGKQGGVEREMEVEGAATSWSYGGMEGGAGFGITTDLDREIPED